MEYRQLGRTGLVVSALGFGCGAVGGLLIKGERREMLRVVARAVELGVTYFDTARSYGGGASEANLGMVLEELRPAVLVGTKVQLAAEDLRDIERAIVESAEGSLRRLRRDQIDLFQLHNLLASERASRGSWLGHDDLARAAEALQNLRRQGKIRAWGINGLGDVVGQWNDATSHAFLWTQTTGMRLLPTLGGTQGVALDLNDAGQVVGWSEPAPGQALEAFMYQNGVTTPLGTLGAPGSVASGINQFGQAVGRASVLVGRRGTGQRPFLWVAGTGMRDLGVPKGSNFGWAVDINSSGAIAGFVQTSSGINRATLWRLR